MECVAAVAKEEGAAVAAEATTGMEGAAAVEAEVGMEDAAAEAEASVDRGLRIRLPAGDLGARPSRLDRLVAGLCDGRKSGGG